MANKNKVISNPITKQEIRFLQTGRDTGGTLLEMQTTYNSRSLEPPPHYHPYQVEDFTVITGEVTVRMDGHARILRAGETLHIPKNKVHSMWNNTEGKTVVNWKIQPAMNTDHFLETAMGLAGDGKVNKQGMPGLLQVSVMAVKFAPVFRLAKPPFALQKVLFLVLSPFAHLLGYRPLYEKYLD